MFFPEPENCMTQNIFYMKNPFILFKIYFETGGSYNLGFASFR